MSPADEQPARQHPVQEDMRSQCRVWRFERIGWYVLLGIVVLTLAGLFGNGPLSQRSAGSMDGRITCEYQAFTRSGSTSSMLIRAQGEPNSQVALLLEGSLFRDLNIESLQPQPFLSLSHGPTFLLHLGTDKEGIATLHVLLANDGVGSYDGRVSLASGSIVRLSTFVYP
ncbi:hypothetical protein EXN22_14045 [Pseudomonas tructae]|uniref:Uncharacterized protein n=1 Tax=Pseudomonas tructae TaxID=2518644 RepID=A0A411MIZ4_9PSED|nr:hypothetical protein [Pseudomonas tructae]QBF26760.1 hypothetical protein EXN22_14045 [Pseudomonas tructae]